MPIETETQKSHRTPAPRKFGNSLLVFLGTLFLLNFLMFAPLHLRLRSVGSVVPPSEFRRHRTAHKTALPGCPSCPPGHQLYQAL